MPSKMAPSHLIFILLFTINYSLGSEVICSLEDYVLTGIEFRQCQKETLGRFPIEYKHSIDILWGTFFYFINGTQYKLLGNKMSKLCYYV